MIQFDEHMFQMGGSVQPPTRNPQLENDNTP